MKKLLTLIGTRPEIIKMSALIPEFDRCFAHVLVDSGQHYSPRMSRLFLDELGLRNPDYSLEVGSHTPGRQIALMLDRFEDVLLQVLPDAVVVHGDTNTTLAGALLTSRYRSKGVRLIHVEAGARSFNADQPEEINRRVVDQLSDLLFVPYEKDRENLLTEGVQSERILVTGNTVVDSCRRIAGSLDGYSEASKHGLSAGEYALATFHRQETVDDEQRLRAVCSALSEIGKDIPVVIPLHPRTQAMIERFGISLRSPRITLTEPLGYRATISLLLESRMCMTDSGGIQEEAAVLGTPALVLRENTEHMRYVEAGMHVLVGTDESRIVDEARLLLRNDTELERRRRIGVSFPENTSVRIVREIAAYLDGENGWES